MPSRQRLANFSGCSCEGAAALWNPGAGRTRNSDSGAPVGVRQQTIHGSRVSALKPSKPLVIRSRRGSHLTTPLGIAIHHAVDPAACRALAASACRDRTGGSRRIGTIERIVSDVGIDASVFQSGSTDRAKIPLSEHDAMQIASAGQNEEVATPVTRTRQPPSQGGRRGRRDAGVGVWG
jgi:hypothetical protein